MLSQIRRWFYERRVQRLRRLRAGSSKASSANSYMDQGDYHSGPLGYSPNTAYPETQYGRMFKMDDDVDSHEVDSHNHEEDEYSNEGDWR